MRILFSVRNPSYVRHYDSVLRLLAARGHEIDLVTEESGRKPWPPAVRALADEHRGIRLGALPAPADARWYELATRLRQGRFYLRFLDPVYRQMPALLARTREKAPAPVVRLSASALGRSALARRMLTRLLDLLERAARTPAAWHDYLRAQRPDAIVLTPLVVLKTAQIDLARAAVELGIRNVFAVASWDHLSSKGELTFRPQRVFVWNDVQKHEAVTLHQVPAERVVVTGSQVFDDWFDRAPSATRGEFCARAGLPADRPILLYVCSALLEGAPPEPEFVLAWARHLRGSGHAVLRECSILVRPHFKRGEEWRGIDFAGLGHIVCWPPAGDVPVDATSKADYFDSLFHASVVVGLNTSALIEAAIVGRPAHTVLLPEYRDSQEGTVHFHYLLDGPGALLHAARSLDDHARQAAAALEGRDPDPGRSARFVRAFVRPGDAAAAATARFVDALEALGAEPAPAPEPAPWWAGALRPALGPFATAAAERVRRASEERRQRKAAALDEHRRARQAARVHRAGL